MIIGICFLDFFSSVKSSTILISSLWCHMSFQMFRQPTYITENSICSRALNFLKALGRDTKFLGLISFNEVTQPASPVYQLAYVAKSSQKQNSNLHSQVIYTHLLLIKSQRLHLQWISLDIRKQNHVHIKLLLPPLDTGFCYLGLVFLRLAACLPPTPRCWEYIVQHHDPLCNDFIWRCCYTPLNFTSIHPETYIPLITVPLHSISKCVV